MYRDWDLLRHILLFVEPLDYPNEYISIRVEDYGAHDIAYHVAIMKEGGLLEAEENPYSCFIEWSRVRLTWAGHELTDLIRDDAFWENAKQHCQALPAHNMQLLTEVLQRRAREQSL